MAKEKQEEKKDVAARPKKPYLEGAFEKGYKVRFVFQRIEDLENTNEGAISIGFKDVDNQAVAMLSSDTEKWLMLAHFLINQYEK